MRDWARGWYRSHGRYGCTAHGCKTKSIPEGAPMFLTGEPGDVLCGLHAELRGVLPPTSTIRERIVEAVLAVSS